MKEIKSYLSFYIGGENYAANVAHVRNIIKENKITKVPEMPDYMLGVINMRGEVLPVVDARIKFGLSETKITVDTCILDVEVVIDNKQSSIGLMVEEVSEVLQIEKEDIKEPPGIGISIRNEFIQGIYHDGDKFIMILDVNKVFMTEEVINMSEITEPAE